MQSRFSCYLIGIICFASSFVSGQKPQPPSAPSNGGDFSTVTDPLTKVPTGVILVKGAVERKRYSHSDTGRRERDKQCLQ